jgi:hypothetical protein
MGKFAQVERWLEKLEEMEVKLRALMYTSLISVALVVSSEAP